MTVHDTPDTPDTPVATVPPIGSIADLLCVVPYHLKHHPHDSLVAVVLHRAHPVLLSRTDLPETGAPTSDLHACLYASAAILSQHAHEVVLIGYGPADRVEPVLAEADEVYASSGVRLLDLLRVTDNRYFSYRRPDPTCPPQGTPFDPASSVPAAYATAAGMVALPDRATLAATIAAVTGPARDSMRQATRRARHQLTERATAAVTRHRDHEVASAGAGRGDPAVTEPVSVIKAMAAQAGLDAVAQAFDRYRHGDAVLTDDEAAWLILLLDYPPVRDLAFAHTTGTIQDIRLWTDLTRRAEPGLVRAPASLLAFAAWRSGDGILARLALDRALADDPTYALAQLLDDVLDSGISPDEWPDPATANGGGERPTPRRAAPDPADTTPDGAPRHPKGRTTPRLHTPDQTSRP